MERLIKVCASESEVFFEGDSDTWSNVPVLIPAVPPTSLGKKDTPEIMAATFHKKIILLTCSKCDKNCCKKLSLFESSIKLSLFNSTYSNAHYRLGAGQLMHIMG